MIALVCTLVVGSAFLFSAFVKAVDGGSFMQDLARYRLLPPRGLGPAAALLTGAEAALGAALVLHLRPAWVVPGTIVVVGGLAGLTLWGEQARDLEDCGCYGGVVLLTPKQSALLDGGYLLLLGAALLWPAGGTWLPALWGLGLVAAIAGAGAVAAWQSRTEPLVDLSRLREGRVWKQAWLPGRSAVAEAPHFVVFLSEDCSYCKRWVPLLNVMNTQSDFPDVLGVMSITDEEMDDFRDEHLIRFPVAQMDRLLFQRMVNGYPTAVLIEDGRVAGKWSGEFPEPYFTRIRQFYESVRETASASSGASGFSG